MRWSNKGLSHDCLTARKSRQLLALVEDTLMDKDFMFH